MFIQPAEILLILNSFFLPNVFSVVEFSESYSCKKNNIQNEFENDFATAVLDLEIY